MHDELGQQQSRFTRHSMDTFDKPLWAALIMLAPVRVWVFFMSQMKDCEVFSLHTSFEEIDAF